MKSGKRGNLGVNKGGVCFYFGYVWFLVLTEIDQKVVLGSGKNFGNGLELLNLDGLGLWYFGQGLLYFQLLVTKIFKDHLYNNWNFKGSKCHLLNNNFQGLILPILNIRRTEMDFWIPTLTFRPSFTLVPVIVVFSLILSVSRNIRTCISQTQKHYKFGIIRLVFGLLSPVLVL